MKQLGLENRLWEQALINEWESLVGPQVAKHARAGRLERKVLHIFVDHPAWLSDLSRYGQKQLVENLQKRFGADKIKGIRLQLDPDHR
jgi:predicted nucleic acid-binding Zn ribbon protein